MGVYMSLYRMPSLTLIQPLTGTLKN